MTGTGAGFAHHRGGRASIAIGFVAAAIVLLGAAGPAAAAGGVEVSRNGVDFAATLPGGVFDRLTIAVPGDVQSTGFWIRNTGPVTARLRIVIAAVSVSDPVLANALTVTASTSAHPGASALLASATPCRVLTEGDVLAPGDSVHVTATLALGDLNGRLGQKGTAGFDLRIELTDSVVTLPPSVCGASGASVPAAGDGDIPLAMTGAEIPAPLVIAATSVLGAGLFLVVAAKRRRRARQ